MREPEEMIVAGDWLLSGEPLQIPNRYTVGYRVRAIVPPARLAARGAFPVCYGTPEVAQDIAERQERWRGDPALALQIPEVTWDGKKLRSIDPDPGMLSEETELGADFPGLVRLPEWCWGPVSVSECDAIIG